MKTKNQMISALILLLGGVLFLSGCSDNFLDKQPTGGETQEIFLTNADQALRATAAIYDAGAWYNSQEVYEWFLGDIVSDDAEKGGESDADWAELQQLKKFVASADNSILRDMYKEIYQGIFRANLVIEKVPLIAADKINPALQARLVGEAKFLRAYYYFKLKKIFNGVPLVTAPIKDASQFCQPRATPEAIWGQIVADLTAAAAVLPEKSQYAPEDLGRATKGAANALLAKAYLFQKNWLLALSTAATVIASGEYSLEPVYADIFTLAKENGVESVFEIQHARFPSNEWGDKNEGQVTTIYQGGRDWSWGGGWGFNCPTPSLLAEFEPGDPRLAATIIRTGDTLWKGTPEQYIADNTQSPTKMHNRKYMYEYSDPKPEMSNSPANWRAIRYADVLLFHAEAANEAGDLAAAATSLNLVRARAGLAPIAPVNPDAMRTAIQHERRVELAMESHRFYDLVRWGKAAELLAANGFVAGKHEYFPIPQIEIDMCPDEIVQNPY